jgi:hypothetical protein
MTTGGEAALASPLKVGTVIEREENLAEDMGGSFDDAELPTGRYTTPPKA